MSVSTTELRHQLHQHPELSGAEHDTASRLQAFFRSLDDGLEIVPLGEAAFAAVLNAAAPGPTVMLRSELDALPIHEINEFDHRSRSDGVAHKCGHDGHMAILAETACQLVAQPPTRGRVVLLFQPAEETGDGAQQIIANPDFAALAPDWVYALHNVPGFPRGQVITRAGTFSCASRGMRVIINGLEAHAAQPETGVSPALALSDLLKGLTALTSTEPGIAFATVTHAQMGARSFGIAPGAAELMVTLRSEHDAQMTELVTKAEALVDECCQQPGLDVRYTYGDLFPATVNDADAVLAVRKVVRADELVNAEQPFRWSEDFGHFTARYPGAMFALGAGENIPALHHPAYDFPDDLIPRGAELFERLIREHCDQAD